jgi:hypothetical protein
LERAESALKIAHLYKTLAPSRHLMLCLKGSHVSPLLHVLMLIASEADADMLAQELRRAGFELAVRHAHTEAAYLTELEAPLDLILADNALPGGRCHRVPQQTRELTQACDPD